MDESGRKWNNPADVLNVVSAHAEPDISTGVWMCDAGLVVCMLATTRITALRSGRRTAAVRGNQPTSAWLTAARRVDEGGGVGASSEL